MFRLNNPVVLFVFTWLLVLSLYSLRYSDILTLMKAKTSIYIGLSCLSFGLAYIFCLGLFKKFNGVITYFKNSSIDKNLNLIIKIWAFFTFIEILYFRSIPLLALMGIGSARYTEWGIPSLHGVLNALILVYCNYNFYLYLTEKKKKYLIRFLLCLCWPILLVTRQVMLSMIIQAVFIYLSVYKLKASTVFKLIIAALVVVFFFGVIGDLRSGGDREAFYLIARPTESYPTYLPSGFMWVYIYITSPLNNVNFNIERFPDFTLSPVYVLSSFFPSFVRGLIFPPAEFKLNLVEYWLNVSGMFPNYLSAFGYWGSIIVYFIMGLSFSFIYFKTKTANVNIKWIFILAVILHNIAFSVFVDFFTSLPFVFQILVHFMVGTKYNKANEV